MSFLGKLFGSKPVIPEVHRARIYTISLIFHSDIRTVLKFNAEISRVTIGDDTRHFFQFNRSDVRINDEPSSDHLASDLAAQCGSVMYPLIIQIADDGHITGIFNHKEIMGRWNEKEPLLKQYFTGPEAAAYIAASKATLDEEITFLHAVKQDLFLTTWCYLMFAGYREQLQAAYCLIPFKEPYRFNIEQTGLRRAETVIQKGKQTDGESTMEIKYSISDSSFIQSMDCIWTMPDRRVSLTAVKL